MSRQRAMTLVTLALLNVFTIAAGATTADLLRAREALLAAPRVAARPLVRAFLRRCPGCSRCRRSVPTSARSSPTRPRGRCCSAARARPC